MGTDVPDISHPAKALIDQGQTALAHGDRQLALNCFSEAIDLALASFDRDLLSAASDPLEKLGHFEPAWRALSQISISVAQEGPPEWDGSQLRGKTIVVEQRIRHLGAVIRLARLIHKLTVLAERCIVLVDPRLETIFRRSFPNAAILPSDQRAAAYACADYRASYETLSLHLIPDTETTKASFVPLRPSPDLTQKLRARYLDGAKPTDRLIGISWKSLNPDKEILSENGWAEMLRRIPHATFVSLQYGDAKDSALRIAEASGKAVLWDDAVDQLGEIDLFCSQIAALDAVISISNTGCHLAGAINVPSVILIDSNSPPVWNPSTIQQVWYPDIYACYCESKSQESIIENVIELFESALLRHG